MTYPIGDWTTVEWGSSGNTFLHLMNPHLIAKYFVLGDYHNIKKGTTPHITIQYTYYSWNVVHFRIK